MLGPTMAHTPTVPADERAHRILERADVDDDHKSVLQDLVAHAHAKADADGQELQVEFGKTHVALIIGCNQFLRLFRDTGDVEILLPEQERGMLEEAGYTTRDAEGAVFQMFGWRRINPMQGDVPQLKEAVAAAYQASR